MRSHTVAHNKHADRTDRKSARSPICDSAFATRATFAICILLSLLWINLRLPYRLLKLFMRKDHIYYMVNLRCVLKI